jgi:hypothetical protein
MAQLVAPLERAGFKVLHVAEAFITIDIPDEPFKHPTSGLTTREALRLRRVIEQPAEAKKKADAGCKRSHDLR